MTILRSVLVAVAGGVLATTASAEISGVYGTSMKPEDHGTQWILGAEYSIRRDHRWRATKLFVDDVKVDISRLDHEDRTFDYDDMQISWTAASLMPRSGLGGSAGIAVLWGWGDVESPTNQNYDLGFGFEAFATLAYSWRIVPVFGIDFGASASGRWVEYDGDAEGEYWAYTVAPILSPYIVVEIEAIDGGFKVYAGPMLHWGEVFMDHETDSGFHEEIRLVHRDLWGVYGGAGLTISFLYIGVRVEVWSALTIKAQAGLTF
jgi:hypothetical protein